MRLNTLTLRDFTRYQGEVCIDFDALGAGLVAIAGANGAGKTSLLEAPCGALHLEFPTRPGALYGVAHGKGASLDLSFSNGAPYRALVAVDALAMKTEAYLYNGDGSPITDGKVRTYQAEIEQRFGSQRLFLSACLSPQNRRGSFLELSKAERKDLLAEILDTGNLQAIAEAARERAKAAEGELATLRGTVAAHQAEMARLSASMPDLELLKGQEHGLQDQIAATEAELASARERYTTAKTDLALAQEAARAREGKVAELEAARRTVGDLEARLAALDGEKRRGHERIDRTIQDAKFELDRLPQYQEAAERARLLTEDIAHLDSLGQEIEGRRLAAASAADAAKEAHRQAERINAQIQTNKDHAALLGQVPCGGEGQFAGCKLIGAARAAGDALPALEAALSQLQPLPDMDALLARVADLAMELLAVQENARQKQRDRLVAQEMGSRISFAKAADSRLGDAEKERLDLDGSISERGAQISKDLNAARASLEKLQAAVDALQATDLTALSSALAKTEAEGRTLKAKLDSLQRELQDVVRGITAAQGIMDRLRSLETLLDGAKAQEGALVAEAGEWSTLERAFGRDGIQALEIDAAGPELSSLTNDLLTSCFGERFEVRFVTQVLKADGKGNKEVFDVQVIDHERGREGAVDSLSGGERTIVSEAISLALAIYTGRHGGHSFETLFRDETAGQLDPDNAHRYVAMLRKAREVGGFHQVIYIAQQPEVWQQADAVLWCQDGKVEVRQ